MIDPKDVKVGDLIEATLDATFAKKYNITEERSGIVSFIGVDDDYDTPIIMCGKDVLPKWIIRVDGKDNNTINQCYTKEKNPEMFL